MLSQPVEGFFLRIEDRLVFAAPPPKLLQVGVGRAMASTTGLPAESELHPLLGGLTA